MLRCLIFFLVAALHCTAQNSPPTIEKIDPPNWFAALPSVVANPVLLIKGTGLQHAAFSISPAGVPVTRTLTSPNGHWAMVWIDTAKAAPGTVQITAKSPTGSTTFAYRIEPTRPANDGAAGFSPADVIYNLMPDRFADGDRTNDPPPQLPGTYDRSKPRSYHGGDLRGISDHLDYLQQLGVTALWLTPIVENAPDVTDYHGYGAYDLYAVDPHFGSLDDYRKLGAALHRRRMKLIFDDVPNHTGPHHPWVQDPPLPDWFHGTLAKHIESSADFDPITDPHASPQASADILDGWFLNILPDLNQENPIVAQYLLQNMLWWIEEAGVDALRIDTFPYSQRAFWQSYLGTLKQVFPHLNAVGEVSGADTTINAFFAGGRIMAGYDTHLDTPFDYPLWHTIQDVLLKGEPMSNIEDTLRQDWLYPHPELLVNFVGNHDVWRFLSNENATPALLRIVDGLVLTMRGVPQLYAGDEVNMEGKWDPDNRRDFPGGFPGDPANAFLASGRTPAQAATHDWVAALGTLRAHSPTLQFGRQQTVYTDDDRIAYVRLIGSETNACPTTPGAEAMLVVVNRSKEAGKLEFSTVKTALEGCTMLEPRLGDTGTSGSQQIQGGNLAISVPAFGFAIYALH